MKFLKKLFHQIVSCPRCYGMGVIELPNGETRECPKCLGKGLI